MIQSWENLVTDGQTDKSYVIGHCPTYVERNPSPPPAQKNPNPHKTT